MNISTTLTALGDAVRSDYLIENRLKISEMTDLIAKKNDLTIALNDNPYVEKASVSKENGFNTITASQTGGRVAIGLAGGDPVGKTVAIYFQASTDDTNGVPLQLGPVAGGMNASLTVKGKNMKGYYAVIKFTANNSLSIILEKAASINIKDLRAWIVS